MSQLCDREAKTIHRLLEPMFDKAGNLRFKKNKNDPLQADVIIVDEASMLELSLAASLLEALPLHGRLVLVGDADQLPPVGAGSFFADLLGVEALPRVRLTEIFRQAQDSDIVLNAHRFNRGEMPALRKNDRDFYFSVSRSADHTVDNVVSLMTQRIPGHFGMVKTTYGYHLMYFVGTTPAWEYYTRQDLVAQRTNELMESLASENPMVVDYKSISLGYVNMGA